MATATSRECPEHWRVDTCRGCLAPIDIYAFVQDDDGKETGMIRRKCYRTPREIFADIHHAMNKSVCKCGHEWKPKQWDEPCPKCKDTNDDCESRQDLIDEYDSCCAFGDAEQTPIFDRDWEVQSIMCFSEMGGNEGYSVYVAVHACRGEWAARETKVAHIYRIKSFAGMEHCHNLVARLQKVMGVWPIWQMNDEDKKKFSPK